MSKHGRKKQAFFAGLLVFCTIIIQTHATDSRAAGRTGLDSPAMSEAQSFEPFKGRTDTAPFELGFMNGLGIIDTDVGFALLGTALVRIVPQGFIGDIDDSVGLELDMGPLFSTQTYAAYSLHVRWDFNRDQDWTFYGLGGVTGHFGSGRSTVLPRFGIGALWRIDPVFAARAEISHEFIVAGISLDFM